MEDEKKIKTIICCGRSGIGKSSLGNMILDGNP
jgi:putative ribosome biogenesis GTPase RsgA